MRITISLLYLVPVIPIIHHVRLVLRVSGSRPRGAAYPKRNRNAPEVPAPGRFAVSSGIHPIFAY